MLSTVTFSTDKGSYSFPKETFHQYVQKQFLQEKKSFLLIPAPNANDFVPVDVVKQIAAESEDMQRQLDIVFQTIPDHNESLRDFHYTFVNMPEKPDDQLFEQDPSAYINALELLSDDKPGLFVNDIDGGKFHFVSQRHYDALGDFVMKYVQDELLKNVGL